MKLEYFAEAFDGAGLLLLYSGSSLEVEHLLATIEGLLVVGTSVPLHALDFIAAVDTCELTARSVKKGGGVTSSAQSYGFLWSLTPSDWEQTHGLLQPFLTVGRGARFQHLHGHSGPEVIYSTERAW